jgi:hypothetical protein
MPRFAAATRKIFTFCAVFRSFRSFRSFGANTTERNEGESNPRPVLKTKVLGTPKNSVPRPCPAFEHQNLSIRPVCATT